ncbi:unnamed protein product [Rotaria sp. Silwood2]|nr:unnamed protein product [Rotaria sp. Silwood2]CAF2942083.1 unnamed protein product [Rotaria sp. Silwood2]CAF3109241.1 unnamed protein product [Rotaria sp. Silwood2]CAF3179854.1 unnamed protein product [Rotaria sp. Silwood2]CAF4000206.1 unnamed protein product [Rotaria sp. Silwood2]
MFSKFSRAIIHLIEILTVSVLIKINRFYLLSLDVFNEYCNEYLLDLYDKLKHFGTTTWISLSWFLTLCVCVMPFETALYVIDIYFFYDGTKVLFQLALTILHENRRRLLGCYDGGDAVMILTTYLNQFYDHKNKNNEEKKII